MTKRWEHVNPNRAGLFEGSFFLGKGWSQYDRESLKIYDLRNFNEIFRKDVT